jgi:hypothetical protein
MYMRTGATFLFSQTGFIHSPHRRPQAQFRRSGYISIQASHAPATPIEARIQIA